MTVNFKHGLLAFFFALSSPSLADPSVLDIGHGIELRPLTPKVHVVTYDNANALIVEMENGEILVVNTLYDTDAANALLAWIKSRYKRYPSAAINTHFHNDTLGGNAAFIAHAIPVYGSDLTVDTLRQREGAMRSLLMGWAKTPKEKEKIAAARFVPPTRAFSAKSGLTLKFGKESVELAYPGPAHAPDNIVVYFERAKVLFGGCMVMAGAKVGNKSDADMATWPQTVEKLRKYSVDFVIPGHGTRFDPGLLDHTLTLLAADGR